MEVVVLAGGLGTRLRSAVADIPKCLAPVAGKPFLEYLLQWLGIHKVEHVVFSVGYLSEQVISFIEGRQWPFSYDFAIENEPLGTGGGIRLALEKCHGDKVVVVNGDTFFPVNLDRLTFDGPVTLALKPMKDFSRYGAVDFQNGVITAFREKAPCADGLINGGVYAIDREFLELGHLPQKFSFEKEVLEPLASIGKLYGTVQDSYFIDIGIPEDYELAGWAIPEWFKVQEASAKIMKADADTLFLDRDGVLNRHITGYVQNWADWTWTPGILDAMREWAGKFRRIILVTNQRGVGKGLMTDEDLARVHSAMMADIIGAGARIDLILCCTAVSDDDPRRKPNPGMFHDACALFPDISASRSVMLGDSPSDAAFASAAGLQFVQM